MGAANRGMLPAVSTLFGGGTFHSSFVYGSTTVVAPQPTGCIDCHLVSQPAERPDPEHGHLCAEVWRDFDKYRRSG